MRICLVSQEYPPETAHGGIGTQTWNKAHGLTALGHEVEVLSCSRQGHADGLRTQEESGIRVHRISPPGEGGPNPLPIFEEAAFQLAYSWAVLEHLHHLSRGRPFDLVNFPEYGAEGFAFLLNRSAHDWMPTVVQLHGPLAMFAERLVWPAQDSRFFRVGTFMESEAIRLADGWMASSANIADFVAAHHGIERGAIDVVHCGLDCNLFRPVEREPAPSARPTVLYVGNLTDSKGLRTVLAAVVGLRARFPHVRLVVLGKGATDGFRHSVAQAGAEDAVELVGFVDTREELVRYYQAADVFASPADHEVGVANVYVEAMACGVPVVAGTTGGAPEAVIDGETGLLVPPRDVDATRAALERLLVDAPLRRRMGAAGRERAEGYFAQERYIERVLAAYARTLERSRERLARARREAGIDA